MTRGEEQGVRPIHYDVSSTTTENVQGIWLAALPPFVLGLGTVVGWERGGRVLYLPCSLCDYEGDVSLHPEPADT